MNRSRRRLTRSLAVLAAISLVACSVQKLPTVPSELTEGVVIYQHADYLGGSALVTKDLENVGDFQGPCSNGDADNEASTWAYCISSIRVAPGWKATIFEKSKFRGASLEVTADVPNLTNAAGPCKKGGLNDCITSIRVTKG